MKTAPWFVICCAVSLAVLPTLAEASSRVSLLAEAGWG